MRCFDKFAGGEGSTRLATPRVPEHIQDVSLVNHFTQPGVPLGIILQSLP